jgi:hypothetical protein
MKDKDGRERKIVGREREQEGRERREAFINILFLKAFKLFTLFYYMILKERKGGLEWG